MCSVFIGVPRTQFCVYCGAQDMFSVYCGAQDTILCLLWRPGHDSMWHPGHDSMFIVVPRCITLCLLPDMILCLLWCPGCDSVFIISPGHASVFIVGAQNTILCLLWCPGHDFVFIVVPMTWFCLLLCPGHAGRVTGSVHSAGEEAEGGLWSPGEEVPQGQEAHQGVSTEVSVDAFSGLHWVFCPQVPSLSSGLHWVFCSQVPSLSSGMVSSWKIWSNSTTQLFFFGVTSALSWHLQ